MLRHPFEKDYKTLNAVLVDQNALKSNLHLFRKKLPGQSICPVLKSNAYGHGLVLTGKILEKERPDFLIVDSLYEGLELRAARIKTPIFVMGYTREENLPHAKGFHFACFNLKNAEILARLKIPAHLKIETGLNRLGFNLEDLKKNLKKMRAMKLNVEGVFTHFSDADNFTSQAYTQKQLETFETAVDLVQKAGFTPRWIHAAASAGALKIKSPYTNLVRLGISLYGIEPYDPKDPYYKVLKDLKPALTLQCRLAGIRTLKKGESVGYGQSFISPKKMNIGIVPVGYYEALPRTLSNKGWVEIRGEFFPIIGRVCMNYIIINLKDKRFPLMEPVVIYSNDRKKKNSVEQVAQLTGTIPNEILVRICESLKRVVI